MNARHLLSFGLVLGALVAPSTAHPLAHDFDLESAPLAQPEFEWNARTAEHLWNRAGFGASEVDIQRALAMGQEAFVAQLLARSAMQDAFMPNHFLGRRRVLGAKAGGVKLSAKEAKQERRKRREADRIQGKEYTSWWVNRMIDGQDPLGERVTLFWHGHFTSSMSDVRNSFAMILQNQLYRDQGMGHFGELLKAVARDPAMLEYLDNRSNVKESPNENFARELLELFTLGEGNYSEADIKEAARAFTGWTDARTTFVFREKQHDFGPKTFMGVSGNLGGEDVLDIVLANEQCARFVAGKLIAYFEGLTPDAERLEEYTQFFSASDLDVGKLLGKLFMDPAFYRDEVIGGRIASPIDFLVGNARRLNMTSAADLVTKGSALLGQRLFDPPNVKGWDGGADWISSSTVFHRGNLAGILLGEVSMSDFLDYDPQAEMGMAEDTAVEMEAMQERPESKREKLGELRGLRELRGKGWNPRLRLTASILQSEANTDAEIITSLTDRLLGVDVGAVTRASLTSKLTERRMGYGLGLREFLNDPLISEPTLRSIAHLILSLPEAQLN